MRCLLIFPFILERRHATGPFERAFAACQNKINHPNKLRQPLEQTVFFAMPVRRGAARAGQKDFFDHQTSYQHRAVRLSVLWSIVQFIKGLS